MPAPAGFAGFGWPAAGFGWPAATARVAMARSKTPAVVATSRSDRRFMFEPLTGIERCPVGEDSFADSKESRTHRTKERISAFKDAIHKIRVRRLGQLHRLVSRS